MAKPRHLDTEAAAANDKRWAAEISAALPVGSLFVCALGWCRLLWWDDCTTSHRFLGTRRRARPASRTVGALRCGPYARDASIQRGPYRAHPCQHPVRLVAGRWQGVGSRDRTPVLDPHRLSARQGCERSRRRGRMEEALALTQRVVDVASWWPGSTHAVPWQISATLICSAVVLTLCHPVAQALGEPVERLAVARVLRAFSHEGQAVPGGAYDDLLLFLTAQAKLLGLVKRRRKQHRASQHLARIFHKKGQTSSKALRE